MNTVTPKNAATPKSFAITTAAGLAKVVHTTVHTHFVPNSSGAVIAGFQVGDAVLVTGAVNVKKKIYTATTVRYDTVPFALPLPAGRLRVFRGTYSVSTSTQLVINPPKWSAGDGVCRVCDDLLPLQPEEEHLHAPYAADHL